MDSKEDGPSEDISHDSEEISHANSEDGFNEELPRTRTTRKRKKKPDAWKNKRKWRRNLGKRYISAAKKVVSTNWHSLSLLYT